MTDLTEFVRARLDEDENAALGAKGESSGVWDRTDGPADWIALYDKSGKLTVGQDRHIARHDPARVLAEVDAKRRIVTEYEEGTASLDAIAHPDMYDVGRVQGMEVAVQMLALPDADHPDYREEWRP